MPSPNSHASQQAPPVSLYTVYRLADATACFRSRLEKAYVSGGMSDIRELDFDPYAGSFPDGVSSELGTIEGKLTILRNSGILRSDRATHDLLESAEGLYSAVESQWWEREHSILVRNYHRQCEIASDVDASDTGAILSALAGSPIDVGQWTEYESAAEEIADALPPGLDSLSRLGRCLARVIHKCADDFEIEGQEVEHCWSDTKRLLGTLAPKVLEFTQVIRTRFPEHAKVFTFLIEGPSVTSQVFDHHYEILEHLKQADLANATSGATHTNSNPTRRDPNKPSTGKQQDILTVITSCRVPLTRREIVEKLRMKTEGKIGGHLAWMVRNHILINIPNLGYWPATEPIPE